MRSRRILSRFGASRRGNAAVEFALLAPVLIVMAAAVYELGRAFQSQSAVNKLASQYATSFADCIDLPAGTCNTELSQYSSTNAIANVAPQLTNAVSLQMFQIRMSGGAPTVQYSYPAASGLSAAQSAAAAAILKTGDTGVVVTVSYTHTLNIFATALSGIVPASIPMSFTVAQLKA